MKTESPSIGTWKRCLVACVVIGLAAVLASAYIQRVPFPDLGFDLRVDAASRNVFVSSVDRATPAWRAGLRPGDALAVKDLDISQRIILSGPTQPSVDPLRVDLPVLRSGSTHRISFAARADAATLETLFANYFVLIGDLLMLAVALLIGTRKPENRDVRDICLVLLTYAVGNGLYNLSLNWAPLLILMNIANLGPILSAVLFGLFAMRFVTNVKARTLATGIGSAIFLAASVLTVLFLMGAATARPDPFWLSRWPWTSYLFAESSHYFFARLFALICGIYAIAASRGAQRQRIVWATAAVAVLYGTAVIVQPLVRLGVIPVSFDEPIVDVGVFLFPIGLAYAVLKRRILDIGFVINRAAVFSGVSIIVVGIFVLVEWLLSEWFGSLSHTANLAIGAALALFLGFSVRAIHQHVDRTLDAVFFRKRHEDEKAIRTFAHEASYITDLGTLIARAKQTLEAHADAAFANLALDDGLGLYGDVSENDPAIVALQAWRQVLDLHTVQTRLQGEFAYPMIARGRLVGALIVGPKRTGESYAPDESDAIAQLAHGVGGALDILTLNAGVSLETLSEQLRDFRDTMVAELRAMRAPL